MCKTMDFVHEINKWLLFNSLRVDWMLLIDYHHLNRFVMNICRFNSKLKKKKNTFNNLYDRLKSNVIHQSTTESKQIVETLQIKRKKNCRIKNWCAFIIKYNDRCSCERCLSHIIFAHYFFTSWWFDCRCWWKQVCTVFILHMQCNWKPLKSIFRAHRQFWLVL